VPEIGDEIGNRGAPADALDAKTGLTGERAQADSRPPGASIVELFRILRQVDARHVVARLPRREDQADRLPALAA
jgi:hypothetical protein